MMTATSKLTPAAAAQYLINIERSKNSFLDYAQFIHPEWAIPDFHKTLATALDLLEKGELRRDFYTTQDPCSNATEWAIRKSRAANPDCLVHNLLITMPPRHSKALALDTPIPTPSGFKDMRDIQPGDTVLTPAGQPTKVTHVSPVFINNDCYRVTMDDGTSIIADADHLWNVRLCRKRPVYKNKTTADLYRRHQVNTDKRSFRIPGQSATDLPPADLPIAPYILGLWLGDGHSAGGRVTTGMHDIECVHEQIHAAGGYVGPLGKTCSYTVHFLRGPLAQSNLLNNKHIPPQYFTASEEQRRALLNGLMDSDGNISKMGQCFFSNNNKALIDDVRTLLFSLGIKNTLMEGQSKLYGKDCGPTYKISFYDDDCVTIPRKAERMRPANRFGRYIKSIEPVPSTPTKCLTVEHPDGLFLAGKSFIPTHNSTYGSVLFPAYFMGRDPLRNNMSCGYNAQLATDFGRQVREIVNSPRHAQVFPHFEMSPDSRSVEVWSTTMGGRAFFIGQGGTTSGRPANCLIYDDPLKARDEAESPTQRNKAWNYYTSALRMRLEPDHLNRPPIHITILTRWHVDDPAGRIQQLAEWDTDWLHINMPAITNTPTGNLISVTTLPPSDPNYLSQSQIEEQTAAGLDPVTEIPEATETALWPERFPIPELKKRERLNPREFASLYQQSPYIEGGNMIKSDWWQSYPPDLNPDTFPTVLIACDTSFKADQQNDPSVMMVGGMDVTGDIYLLDVIRKRLEFPDLKRAMIRLNTKWRGKGLKGIYIEDKASGQSMIQELKRESGMAIIPHKVVHDKVARLKAVLPLIEGGRVFIPSEADWLDDFINECQAFPSGTHDDQVDALVILLDAFSRMATGGAYYQPPGLPDNFVDISGSLTTTFNQLPDMQGWGE